MDKEPDRDGEGWTYYPVVRFRTPAGAMIVARTKACMFRPGVSPGDRVEVRYQTGNPKHVVIDTVTGRGLVDAAIFAIFGLGMLAGAVYLGGW